MLLLDMLVLRFPTSTDNLLNNDFEDYGWLLQNCWIKELWRFLWKIQGSIEIIDDWKQERCENDMLLMRQVCSMNITKDQIQQFNLCRLYKHATFVSEILDHDRHKLHYDILNPNTSLQVEERFPRIEVPPTYWATWSKALAAIKQANSISIARIGPVIHKQRDSFLTSPDSTILYEKANKQCRAHKLLSIDCNTFIFSRTTLYETHIEEHEGMSVVMAQPSGDTFRVYHKSLDHSITNTPMEVYRAKLKASAIATRHMITTMIHHTKNFPKAHPVVTALPKPRHVSRTPQDGDYDASHYFEYRNWWNNQFIPTPIVNSTQQITRLNFGHYPIQQSSSIDLEFFQHIQRLHPTLRRNIGRIEAITNIEKLADSLEYGNSIAVCDASVNIDQLASHSYIIETKNEKHHLRGNAPVDCDEDDIEST